MTTIPTTRPVLPAVVRPALPGPAAGGIPTIDPIKLVKRFKWLLLGAVGVGLLLGTIAHFVLLWVYPIWSPVAVFQCNYQEADPGTFMAPAGFEKELDKFMATQVQNLTSERIIDKAMADPTLRSDAPRWSGQFVHNGTLDAAEAGKELKKKLSAGVLGESNLIQLSFWWRNPEDATAIVKLITNTYLADSKQIADGTYADRRALISRSIADTTTEITQRQQSRVRKLVDQHVDTLEQQNSTTLKNIANMQEKLVELRGDKDKLVVQRDQLQRELDAAQGITYPDDIRQKVDQDVEIQRIKDDYNTLQAELSAARQRFGPDHPTIRRLQTLLDGREQNLKTEQEKLYKQYFDAKLQSLKTEISGMEATEDDLLKKLEAARSHAEELSQTLASVKDIDNEITRLNESKNKLQDDLKTIDILTANKPRVIVYQGAQKPKVVTFPKLYVMMPAGAFLVLGLVCGAILLVEVVDQRIKSPADVAMVPRTRPLGLVPHASEDPGAPARVETVFRDQPGGVLAEHFRQLRGTVLKRMHAAGHKSLVVMSGQPASGATTVVCNLAQAMITAEQRVLVIDANFRRPGVHRVFGLNEGPGLADVLAGQKSLAEAVQATDDPRLSVLTAGSPDKRRFERLATEPMSELLRQAGVQYDVVLLDVSPASISGDALAVANRCDATMLVVRAFGEKRGMVARLRNELSEVRAEFLGVLVNAVRSSAGGYLKGNILATHQYQNDQVA